MNGLMIGHVQHDAYRKIGKAGVRRSSMILGQFHEFGDQAADYA